jgi:hypothetical protein
LFHKDNSVTLRADPGRITFLILGEEHAQEDSRLGLRDTMRRVFCHLLHTAVR